MFELSFRPIELADRARAEECLSRSGFMGCEYTFGNNYIWAEAHGVEVCFYGDLYFCKTTDRFLFPAGGGSTRRAVELILDWCGENGAEPVITADAPHASEIAELFGAHAEPQRDLYDYVYRAQALAELSGKRYHSKRNHIARFCENDWSFEPITPQNLDECAALNDLWRREYAADAEMLAELHAVERALESFGALGFVGGLLRVDGKPCAFSFGEGAGSMFVVHAEKALRDVQGAYAAINRELVRSLGGRYEYINREDDAGAENLRKAKLSYHPEFLVEKYRLTFGG